MSEPNDCDLICIGSGPAGQRAAVQAAKLGKRVVLIEKQRCIGGVCIETGTIPSKTFREAVRRLYAPAPLDVSETSVYGAPIRPTMPQLVNQVGRVFSANCRTSAMRCEGTMSIWFTVMRLSSMPIQSASMKRMATV